MHINTASHKQLQTWEQKLRRQFHSLKSQQLQLDLTRGKPSAEQLSLSDKLDGILEGNYLTANGMDARNYGGLDGIGEAKQLGADILGVSPTNIVVGGNSSLSLMYFAVQTGMQTGFSAADKPWSTHSKPSFICPVPGYDRHFTVTQSLGVDMVTVPLLPTGPDMDAVEELLANNPSIVGMWCVPKYSNPTGIVYDEQTVNRIAKLGTIAGSGFRVFWDNAYAVHDLVEPVQTLANIEKACHNYNTEDSVIQFASTSKITYAGAGISFMAASQPNRDAINRTLSAITIGPDKVNQLRHCRLLPTLDAVKSHMKKHAAIIRPRFNTVLNKLDEHFADSDLASWETPSGGYFISLDTGPGCAKQVVQLAAEAGVKLTPAGATFPYGHDPKDNNIRIAPTVPSVHELEQALEVFVTCVKWVSVSNKLKEPK